jgi:hypothetical protein
LDEQAAETFDAYLTKVEETGLSSPETVTHAHKFLALYNIKHGNLRDAQHHALGLQEYVHVRLFLFFHCSEQSSV